MNLPVTRREWIAWADYESDWLDALTAPKTIQEKGLQAKIRPKVIRGCHPEAAARLMALGWSSVDVGSEAVLKTARTALPHPSVRELARRGLRHGQVLEVPMTEANLAAAEELRSHSRPGTRPRLRHLYRDDPAEADRLFWFDSPTGPMAAVTLSLAGPGRVHAELMLRRADAPVGVMEALIVQTAGLLSDGGVEEWSLGECPFHFPNGVPNWVGRLGRLTDWVYSSRGLARFKGKFETEWRPVSVCAEAGLSLATLAEMAWACGWFRLAGYRVLR